MKKILFLLIILSTILLGKDIKTNELLKNLNNPEWIIIDKEIVTNIMDGIYLI